MRFGIDVTRDMMESGRQYAGPFSFGGDLMQERNPRLVVRAAVEVEGGSRRERFEAAELVGTALARALGAGATASSDHSRERRVVTALGCPPAPGGSESQKGLR